MCRGSVPITKRHEEFWPDDTLIRVKAQDFLVLSGVSLAVPEILSGVFGNQRSEKRNMRCALRSQTCRIRIQVCDRRFKRSDKRQVRPERGQIIEETCLAQSRPRKAVSDISNREKIKEM